jgi:hypothetical protein
MNGIGFSRQNSEPPGQHPKPPGGSFFFGSSLIELPNSLLRLFRLALFVLLRAARSFKGKTTKEWNKNQYEAKSSKSKRN